MELAQELFRSNAPDVTVHRGLGLQGIHDFAGGWTRDGRAGLDGYSNDPVLAPELSLRTSGRNSVEYSTASKSASGFY